MDFSQVENFPIKTAKYSSEKAKEIRQYRPAVPGKTNFSYPGSLCVETIISLEEAAEGEIGWKEVTDLLQETGMQKAEVLVAEEITNDCL